jgi:hypothetical protein
MAKHEDDHGAGRTENLMKRTASEVKEPEELTPGDWEMRCTGGRYKENEDFDADKAPDRFSNPRYRAHLAFVPVKAVGNVSDPEKVAEGTWRGKTVFARFGIASDADLWDLNKIFVGLGLSLEDRDYDDLFPLAKDKTAIVTVGLRTFKRRDGVQGKENTLTDFRQSA